MSKLAARIIVLLKAAPTYLVAAGAAIAIVADEVSKVVPDGWEDNVTQWAGAAVGIIAAATAIVRRVTPVVDKNAHGLLPPGQ